MTSESAVMSWRLQDLLQCDLKDKNGASLRILITSATAPFHIEWVSKGWCEEFGWSSDEILGHDCKFLHGMATNIYTVSNFMRDLKANMGHASMTVLNYRKDGTAVIIKMNCLPLKDVTDGRSSIFYFVGIVVDVTEAPFPDANMYMTSEDPFSESGLFVDRRDQCKLYRHMRGLETPQLIDWIRLMRTLTLPYALRYTLRSTAAHLLTDRRGRIVHVNQPWVELTGLSAIHCMEVELKTMFDIAEDEVDNQICLFERLFADSFQRTDSAATTIASQAAIITLRKDAVSGRSMHVSTPWGRWCMPSPIKNNKKVLRVCPVAIGDEHVLILVMPYRVYHDSERSEPICASVSTSITASTSASAIVTAIATASVSPNLSARISDSDSDSAHDTGVVGGVVRAVTPMEPTQHEESPESSGCWEWNNNREQHGSNESSMKISYPSVVLSERCHDFY
jgi:PAS domain S-box-containing protein